jgi:hypothetical protein
MAPKTDVGNKRKLPSGGKDSSSKKPKREKRPAPPPVAEEEDDISDASDSSDFSDNAEQNGAPLNGKNTHNNSDIPIRSGGKDGLNKSDFENSESTLTGACPDFDLNSANSVKAKTQEKPI